MKHSHFHEESRTYFVHYDCMSDMIEDKVSEKCSSAYSYFYDSYKNNGVSWYGWSMGIEGARHYLQNGWPEELERVRSLLPEIEIPVMRTVRRRHHRAAMGNELDITRVYSGDIDRAWDATYRDAQENRGKFNAVVVVNCATSSRTKSSEAFWRGASAAMLVDAIQKSGRSVQVVLNSTVDSVDRNNNSFNMSVTIKDFDEPLDIERLIVACSIGFYRSEVFKSYYKQDFVPSPTLGRLRANMTYPLHLKDANIFMTEVPQNTLSKQSAENVLRQAMEKLDPTDTRWKK